MAACEAAISLLVTIAVWRLTERRGASLAAGLLALLTPWSLREHAQLLPETVAAPLVLGTALLASRRQTAAAGGVLAVLAASLKLPILLPVLGAVAFGRDRRRGLITLAVTGVLGAVLFLALFGSAGFDNVVRAQRQAGYASASYVFGLWGQAGWNLLPLAVPAVLAWIHRDRIADRDLAKTLAAALAGSLLLLPTVLKFGSSLTVMVVIEPLVLCLAACGVALALDHDHRERVRGLLIAAAAAAVLGAGQIGSLLVSPGDPAVFTRPFAESGPERLLSSAEVDREVARLRACAQDAAFGGPPFLAFRADRRIAGAQPDQFLIRHAPVLASFRRAADSETRLC